MKRYIYVILLSLLPSLSVHAQWGTDPVLQGKVRLWTGKAKKQYENQIGRIGAIAGEHVLLEEEERQLYNLHKELNDYLSSFKEYVVYAAEGYGFYMEIQYLLDNMSSLSKQIEAAPANAVAVTLCERRKIYPELLKKSLKIFSTIKQVCFRKKDGTQSSKMTQEERLRLLYSVRPQLYAFNKDLRKLVIYVKYTSMADAWRMMTHKSVTCDKGAIARESLAAWKQTSRSPMSGGSIWDDIRN